MDKPQDETLGRLDETWRRSMKSARRVGEEGLSNREWFAGMALQSLIAKYELSAVDSMVKRAFEIADAMIQYDREGAIEESKEHRYRGAHMLGR